MLGDIGGVIADALEIARHEQQLRGAGDGRGVLDHERDEIAEDRVVERIDLGIALDHFLGQRGIARGIGGQHVADHAAGHFGHRRQQGQRLEPGAALDVAGALGDVLGIVADALEDAGDLQPGDHFAQIVGHRRAQRQHPDRQFIDIVLDRVDAAIALDHPGGEALVARDEGIHRLIDSQLG